MPSDPIGFFVNTVTFNDGTTVHIPPSGVVLIVGPNNSGKSQALRDVQSLSSLAGTLNFVLSGATFRYEGTGQQVADLMLANGSVTTPVGQTAQVRISAQSMLQQFDQIPNWWPHNGHFVSPYFMLLADTKARLSATEPVEVVNFYSSTATKPLQLAFQHPDIMIRLDEVSRRALGKGVFLDRHTGGSHWALRVGDEPKLEGHIPTEEYVRQTLACPLVHNQGDGVKSFVGLMLDVLAGHQTISLVDEPEAFLHPPQARFVGRLLGDQSVESRSQSFVSTHSTEVLNGALEANPEAVTVIRLVREDNVNHASVLDNDRVAALWSDPLLRYSRLLKGLFNDAVILCESDSDCRYYSAIFDTLTLEQAAANSGRRMDVLFTHTGGKARLHAGVQALRAVNVPVVTIADFDILNDRDNLKRLVESYGSDFTIFDRDYARLAADIRSRASAPSTIAVAERVQTVFSESTEPTLTPTLATRVRQLLKTETGWEQVKKTGTASLPHGDIRIVAARLLHNLNAIGICVVPSGELESFAPTIDGHGPAWVAGVLEARGHIGEGAQPARDFISTAVAALRSFGA
jgi:hypothetical protein